mmetsp:Transcript_106587/g.188744  ORF Transcript_106587/g.188744 Transcript_106587/m.188744 type:complete len:447 (-) Transcript_106587:63-1403(-)
MANSLRSQSFDQGVVVYADKTLDRAIFSADNSTGRFVHIQLRVRGTNVANCDNKQALVPPFGTGFGLGEVWKEDQSSDDFEYKWTWTMTFDDPFAVHDDSVVYRMPFDTSRAFCCCQGYNGHFSHWGHLKYSIDWNTKPGTPVVAAREGIVTRIRDDSQESGPMEEFRDKANLVSITHADRTIGEYLHLQYRGVVVRVGEFVEAGQVLGYSGSTGWSTTPHIHFHVCKSVLYDPLRPDEHKFQTLPVKFGEDGWVPARGNWCPVAQSTLLEENKSNGVAILVHKRGEAAVDLRARNENSLHADLSLEVTGENIDVSKPVPFKDVIPAGSERFLVRIEQVSSRRDWKYHFKYTFENKRARELECESSVHLQEIAHMFAEIDINENGFIVKNEYWNWLRSTCAYKSLSATCVNRLWSFLDPSGEGRVQFRQFLQAAAAGLHIPKFVSC